MTALLLVAHGDPDNAASSAAARATARTLEALGCFDPVRVGTLKEQPDAAEILRGLAGRDVWVVPYFMAEGWFTGTVLPRVLDTAGVSYRQLPAIGTAHGIDDAVVERARQVAHDPAHSTLALLGHGTRRSATSRDTTLACAQRLSRRGLYAEVLTAFTDDDPGLDTLDARVTSPTVVAVPFFAGEGFHPSALRDSISVSAGRTLLLASSAGSSPLVAQLVVDMVAHHRKAPRADASR